MLFYLLVAVVFLAIVTLLVAAHELGHYLFARLFGMHVEEFAIGFGKKPIWTWMRRSYEAQPAGAPSAGPRESGLGEIEAVGSGADTTQTTEFTIRPWPLGGFVRIKGMVPEEDGSEVALAGGFYSKPPWQRLIVLIAGPVFSVLAGFAVLIPLFAATGVTRDLNEPILGRIAPNSPAAIAGLLEGDRIISIGGKPLATFFDLISIVRDQPGVPLEFVYRRGPETRTLSIIPEDSKEPVPLRDRDLKLTTELRRQGKIGVLPKQRRVQLSFLDAASEALQMPGQMVVGLIDLARRPSQFKEQVGGPLTMVAATAATARSGLPDVLAFAGMLSIWLGIFNLLPVPPLDGGQMAIALAEMLRGGRRLSLRVQSWVSTVGLALVALLFVSVFVIDIDRWLIKPRSEKPAVSAPEPPPR